MGETDAEVYARLCALRDTRRVIDQLAYELTHGDADTRRTAETWLRDRGATLREVAAVKRHLKR